MSKDLIIVIGAYGSGKSEYSINLARNLKQNREKVSLVDLDVVNPYFRSRDMREDFEKEGIRVISPEGEYKYADLPMLSAAIMGVIQDDKMTSVLDVGGDPAGCRTLARYIQQIQNRGYEMHFVINTKRPFTSNQKEIIQMMQMLESTSRLKVTELICNTNLMEYTDEKIIAQGIEIIEQVALEKELKFDLFLVLDKHNKKIPDSIRGKHKKIMKYFLQKPWEIKMPKGI